MTDTPDDLVNFLQDQCSYHLQRIASEQLYEKPNASIVEWHNAQADRYARCAKRIEALESRARVLQPFVEVFDALEAKLEWEGSHTQNNWEEWRKRYERFEATMKQARRARAALAGDAG